MTKVSDIFILTQNVSEQFYGQGCNDLETILNRTSQKLSNVSLTFPPDRIFAIYFDCLLFDSNKFPQ